MTDASAWAWEFLRRNHAYQLDFDRWRRDFTDSPPPLTPMAHLINYLCDPAPSGRHTTYEEYCQEAPHHSIRSINDHLRVHWELNSLVDPALSYSEVRPTRTRAEDTRHLKWLFARNTVDVIKPIESTYLGDPFHLAPISATCGNREVLVRLRLDGDIDNQMASLERQLRRFFEHGSRSHALMIPQYATVRQTADSDAVAVEIDPTYDPDEAALFDDDDMEIVQFGIKGWNERVAERKFLPYLLRAADFLADLEEQKLAPGDGPFDTMLEAFHALCNANPDGNQFDAVTIDAWITQAAQLIHGDYARLARADFSRKTKR
ncbi:hypothetical protein DF011_04015 [Burkholderia ubonensis]|nr:hypothetical protein CJO70_12230 [Burkholderia ubonensis]PAJ94086.1 hypothetical protein CJO69_12845 [Burkholderia ubonensis]RQP79798.1 hypothetical protein DF013_06425 [Burkholderia ubonensis]RQP89886.1 hypothetical protein DF014_04005 [Burkholderia ubonensis]RQQ18341.1 hypothetical protein DF011_04015 [Burkholderia ubonensis]